MAIPGTIDDRMSTTMAIVVLLLEEFEEDSEIELVGIVLCRNAPERFARRALNPHGREATKFDGRDRR